MRIDAFRDYISPSVLNPVSSIYLLYIRVYHSDGLTAGMQRPTSSVSTAKAVYSGKPVLPVVTGERIPADYSAVSILLRVPRSQD
jgi:hypothetical protein